MSIRIDATWILPVCEEPIRNGSIIVSDGKIEYVGARKDINCSIVIKPQKGEDLTLLPGLINGHCHLELSSMGGKVGKGAPFTDWIQEVISYRKNMSKEQVRSSISSGIQKAIQSGTTCIGEYSSNGISVEILKKAGVRARVFAEVSGFQNSLAKERLDSVKKITEACPQQGHIAPGIAPHAPYSTSAKLIQQNFRYAVEKNIPFSIHLAEIDEEKKFLNGVEGEMHALLNKLGVWDTLWSPPHCSPVQYLYSLSTLNHCSAVHVNFANKEDLQLLKNNACTVVRCPGSNKWFNREDTTPLPDFLEKGITVALGTDGLSSNDNLDLFREMRLVHELYPLLDMKEILKMATVNGAKAIRLDDTVGILSKDMAADLVAVTSNRRHKGSYDILFDPDIIVQLTMVGGEMIYRSHDHSPQDHQIKN